MYLSSKQKDIKNILIMIEAANRLQAPTLEESFANHSLKFLLTEDITSDEAKALDDAISKTKDSLDDLLNNVFPGSSGSPGDAGKMNQTKAYFKKLQEELPKDGTLAGIKISGDVKALKKAIESASSKMVQIQAAKDSYVNALMLLGTNLMKLDYQTDPAKYDHKLSLKAITEIGEDDRGGVPDETALRKGIERSYVPSKESKGLFGKIKDFFRTKTGAQLDKKVFVNEVMELSWEELMSLVTAADKNENTDKSDTEAAGALNDMQDDLETISDDAAAEESGTATGESSDTDAEASDNEDAPEESEEAKVDAEAEALANDIGSGPISKSDFGNLIAKNRDISATGKKGQRARSRFRKAINKIAGKEIFEESIEYTLDEIIEESVRAINEKREIEELIVYRWNKLAGLK